MRVNTKKIIMTNLITLVMGLYVTAGTSGNIIEVRAASSEISNPRISEDGTVIWDTVEFGSYYQDVKEFKTEPIKWRVLSINDDGTDAIVMADQTLDYKQYNEQYTSDVRWEDCSLRKWLNNDFYDIAFLEKEKSAIHTSNVSNQSLSISDGNQMHVTNGGSDTIDKIYLLSLEEALDSSYGFDRDFYSKTHMVNPTDYTRYKGAAYEYSDVKKGGCWGLRTTENTSNRHHFLKFYYYGAGSNCVNYDMPVRPVMHIDLSSNCIQHAGEIDSNGNITTVMNGYNMPRKKKGVTTWDCIYFGRYKQTAVIERKPISWRILSVNEDGTDAFLMSNQVLDCKFYNDNDENVTWETCSIRKWLNEEFYEDAFTEVERSAIILTNVRNVDNSTYGTDGGRDTMDRVYLLSADEASDNKYGFYKRIDEEGCAARKLLITDYARIQGQNIDRRIKWWLRSPGKDGRSAAIVYKDGEGSEYGYWVCGDLETAVCPVLHVDLSALNLKKKGTMTVIENVGNSDEEGNDNEDGQDVENTNGSDDNKDDENEQLKTISFNVTYHQTEARSMLESINGFRQDTDNAWYWDEDDVSKVYPSGLNPLKYDYDLEMVAMQRAAEICLSYGHLRPDGTYYYNIVDGYSSSGENIAYGQTTSREVFVDWREDDCDYLGQGHRRNMLNESFNRVGVACAEYQGRKFWVQIFGYTSKSLSNATTANNSDTVATIQALESNIIESGFYSVTDNIQIEVEECKNIQLPQPYVKLSSSPFTRCSVNDSCEYTITDTSIAFINSDQICGLKEGTTTLNSKCNIAGKDVEKNITLEVYAHPNPVENVSPTCYENLSRTYPAADGTNVSTTANGKPKLIIFYNEGCFWCGRLFDDIAEQPEKYKDVDILAIDMYGSDLGTLRNYASNYGDSPITFCSGEYSLPFEYVSLWNDSSSLTVGTPLTIFVNKDNLIVYNLEGYTYNFADYVSACFSDDWSDKVKVCEQQRKEQEKNNNTNSQSSQNVNIVSDNGQQNATSTGSGTVITANGGNASTGNAVSTKQNNNKTTSQQNTAKKQNANRQNVEETGTDDEDAFVFKNATYEIMSNNSVMLTYINCNSVKSFVVPDTVTYNKKKYKVVCIFDEAFMNCKSLKKITIGKNIDEIGDGAFGNCKSLKKIIIKSTKLTKNSFGKNAFKGINKKATFKCPKKQFKNYKKWIKKAGAPKSVKYKK